ncbi:MAG: imidazolonepropionase [Nakamurella sp.]
MRSTLITGIGQLVTNDPERGPGLLGVVSDAAVVIADGHIQWVGAESDAPQADESLNVAGHAVLPGWVDSHTHLVFAGDRAAEFTARMSGAPYEAGGMRASVDATRAADDSTLAQLMADRIKDMHAAGTTCIETKTGYGLTVIDEARSARVAAAAGVDEITFLGAHVVPAEYDDNRGAYLDLVCGPMLAAVKGKASWIDVFCETGAFDEAESRRVLEAGRAAGLGLRVHGNQLGPGPGVQLAVEMGAASVDHCTYLTDADVAALADTDTVATLLPATDLSTRQSAAPGRRLVDAGAHIALATNCNPGTSYTASMPLVIALAVLQCGLSAEEAVHAATAGGARALRRDDVGVVRVGARGDLQVIDAPTIDHIAYRVGGVGTRAVWRAGKRVA